MKQLLLLLASFFLLAAAGAQTTDAYLQAQAQLKKSYLPALAKAIVYNNGNRQYLFGYTSADNQVIFSQKDTLLIRLTTTDEAPQGNDLWLTSRYGNARTEMQEFLFSLSDVVALADDTSVAPQSPVGLLKITLKAKTATSHYWRLQAQYEETGTGLGLKAAVEKQSTFATDTVYLPYFKNNTEAGSAFKKSFETLLALALQNKPR